MPRSELEHYNLAPRLHAEAKRVIKAATLTDAVSMAGAILTGYEDTNEESARARMIINGFLSEHIHSERVKLAKRNRQEFQLNPVEITFDKGILIIGPDENQGRLPVPLSEITSIRSFQYVLQGESAVDPELLIPTEWYYDFFNSGTHCYIPVNGSHIVDARLAESSIDASIQYAWLAGVE